MNPIPKSEYDFISALLLKESGLSLGEGKEYLLDSRLSALTQEMGLKSVSDLINNMILNPFDRKLIKKVNDLMTTNESLFFRDYTPFEILQIKFLPEIHRKLSHVKRLNIWSAACSTGQEPYSIAMMFLESHLDWRDWQIQIIATDYADSILERARSGSYSAYEVGRGLPPQLLLKYFEKIGESWVVKPEVKKFVNFRHINLLDPFTMPVCDIIFLRNVLIYFEREVKTMILDRLAHVAPEDGILLLGGAESVYSLTEAWESIDGVRASIYKKKVMKK